MTSKTKLYDYKTMDCWVYMLLGVKGKNIKKKKKNVL